MSRFRQALLATFLGIGAAALLIFPTDVAAAARESARLAFASVLPSLFPFLIAADLLISLRVTNAAGQVLGGAMPALFKQPREAAPVLLLGVLSGYPVGAAAARRLYEEGGCTAEQAERLVALCNNSGPAFVVGVVGAALWNSPKVGWMLYGCHLAAALLSGLPDAVSLKGLGVSMLLALVCTLGGHSMQNYALRFYKAPTVSAVFLTEVFTGPALVFFILGEAPPMSSVLGGVVILLGVGWYMLSEWRVAHGVVPSRRKPQECAELPQ